MYSEYFAWLDTGEIVKLGFHDCFDSAAEKADNLDRPCNWVFNRVSLIEMQNNIGKALIEDKP